MTSSRHLFPSEADSMSGELSTTVTESDSIGVDACRQKDRDYFMRSSSVVINGAHLMEGVDPQTNRSADSGATCPLSTCPGGSDLLDICEPDSDSGSDLASTESARVFKSDDKQPETYVHDKFSETAKWRPFWSRPVILNAFGALFASIMVVLIFMAVYSKANNGLADAYDELAYVWRFGPTACKKASSKYLP